MGIEQWRKWVYETVFSFLKEEAEDSPPPSLYVEVAHGQHLAIVFHLDWFKERKTANSAVSVYELFALPDQKAQIELLRHRYKKAVEFARTVKYDFASDDINVVD